MKQYKIIAPEVAGSLGTQTVIDISTHPPLISTLHYEFFGWQGDDILESFPCFIVTEKLKKKIEENKLTGITFDNVIITKSEEFMELYGDLNLPQFYWLKVNGCINIDDFCISKKNYLMVSLEASIILKECNLEHSDLLEEYMNNEESIQ